MTPDETKAFDDCTEQICDDYGGKCPENYLEAIVEKVWNAAYKARETTGKAVRLPDNDTIFARSKELLTAIYDIKAMGNIKTVDEGCAYQIATVMNWLKANLDSINLPPLREQALTSSKPTTVTSSKREQVILLPERKPDYEWDTHELKYSQYEDGFIDGFNDALSQIALEPMDIERLMPSGDEFCKYCMSADGPDQMTWKQSCLLYDWLRAHITGHINHSGEGK